MFVIILLLCVLYYYYVKKFKYSYWSRMGVKGPTSLPIVGNFGKLMARQQSVNELARQTYLQYPQEKIVGLYCGFRKVVVIRDPDIARNILTKDFKCFMNRGLRTRDEGFCNNLLTSEGDTWRTLRRKLTPAFSGIKLKQMVPLVHECIDKWTIETKNRIKRGNPCDITDLSGKYSLDIICSCIFGLIVNVYSDENKHLREISKVATQPLPLFWLWYVAEMIIPGIHSKLTRLNPGSRRRDFFLRLVSTVIDERESRKIKRNDLMNIMIELKAQDDLKVDEGAGSSGREMKIDNNAIASQAFAFYSAGQDTSASALSFLLYELSLHPDIQNIVHEEVCKVYEKFQGITYDSLKELTYLCMVFSETLRKHPPVGFVIRQAASNYTIPNTRITIEAETIVLISSTAMHNDAKYFKEPDTFNPENFSKENMEKIPQNVFMPFGDGPRYCIAQRLAEMNVLMAAAIFVKTFVLSPCHDSTRPIEYNSHSISLAPIGGIWVNVCERKKDS